jgi:hypothetical protein
MPFGATPTSTTPLGANEFPASSVYVPNTANSDFTALQGGPSTIDDNGRASAPAMVTFGGTVARYVPGNSGVVVVRAGAGRLASVIVIISGSAQLTIYDNATIASGTPIGAVPAFAAVGSVYQFYSPAVNGILADSVANCCSVTICYD